MAGWPTPLPDGIPPFDSAGFWGPEPITDGYGNTLAGAWAHLYYSDGTTVATLYSDETRGQTVPNPMQVDQFGNVTFYADPGVFVLRILDDGHELLSFNLLVNPHPVELAGRLGLTQAVADTLYLAISGKAADSDLLDGQDSSAFSPTGHGHAGEYSDPAHRHDPLYSNAQAGAQNIWVQPTEPTALEVGDIWIQTA